MSAKEHWCRACHGRDLSQVGQKDGYGLWRCATCATVIVDPYPNDDELNEFYQSYMLTGSYLNKLDRKLKRGRGRVKLMLRHKPVGKRFLEIGCSVGTVCEAAHQLGLQPHGIDLDADAVGKAKELFGNHATFESLPIGALAQRGDQYDMVYMSEVVEHVNDPEAFINDVAKVMAPGAMLYLTAPDGAHYGVPKDFATWNMVNPPNHLTYFSRKGIRQLLARHGLLVSKFRPAFKPGLKLIAYKVA